MGNSTPTKNLPGDIRLRLERKRRNSIYRNRHVNEGMVRPWRTCDGRRVLSFCSNDYLGLAADPRVIAAFQRGAASAGVGSGAACLVSGYTRAHYELEERLAEFTGRSRALLFSTGYMANLGVGRALAGHNVFPGRQLLEDRLNHASLIDAATLAQAPLKRYAHADIKSLERILARGPGDPTPLVASDAVFSMDGDIAPLADLAAVCKKHGATLFIDDAHGFGVFGARGAGTLEQQNLSQQKVPVLTATFGKACGTFGAFAAGSEDLIEWLVQEARTYIYTTAPPAAIAYATLESLRIIEQESWRRNRLHDNIALFRRLAREAELCTKPSSTPIQPLIVGPAETARALGATLLEKGLQITAIRPPTVPEGSSRLRICLSATHTSDDIEQLVAALSVQLRRLAMRPARETTKPDLAAKARREPPFHCV